MADLVYIQPLVCPGTNICYTSGALTHSGHSEDTGDHPQGNTEGAQGLNLPQLE